MEELLPVIQEGISVHIALFQIQAITFPFLKAFGAYPPDGYLGLEPNGPVKRMLMWHLSFRAVEKRKALTTQEPGC